MMLEHLMVRITGDGSQYVATMHQISSATQQWRQGMTQAGVALSAAITAPMVLLGTVAVREGTKFETTLAQIRGLVGASAEQVSYYNREIQAMAPAVARGPNELASALYFVTSSGFEGAAAVDILKKSAMGAAAGLGETQTIADLTTSVMSAYGAQNIDAARTLDVLVQAVRDGKAEAPAMAGSLGMVIGVSSQMGVSFDQVAAAVAGMTRTGYSAETGAVNLTQILTSLLNPTRQAENELANMGLTAQGLRDQMRVEGLLPTLQTLRNSFGDNEEAIANVFGNVRALRGVLSLIGPAMANNVGIFHRVANASGTLNQAFAAVENTVGHRWNQTMAILRVEFVRLQEIMQPVIHFAISAVQFLVGAWAALPRPVQTVIMAIGALAATLGPLLIFLGFVAPAFSHALTVVGILFAPLIPVILAVGAAIGFLVLYAGSLSAAWTMVKNAAVNAWTWIQARVAEFIEWSWPIWTSLWQLIVAVWEIASAYVQQFVSTAISVISGFWAFVTNVWGMLFGQTQMDWGLIRDYIVTVFQGLIFVLRNFDMILAYTWTAIQLGFIRWINVAIYWVTVVIPAYLVWFATNWRNIFTTIWNFTSSVFRNMGRNIESFFINTALWMTGQRTNWQWTGLLDGFQSTLSALPQIAAREMSPLERQLQRQLDVQGKGLNQRWEEQLQQNFAGPNARNIATPENVQQMQDVGEQLGNGVGAGMNEAIKGTVQNLDPVLRWSQEAFQRIAQYEDRFFGGGSIGGAGRTSAAAAAIAAARGPGGPAIGPLPGVPTNRPNAGVGGGGAARDTTAEQTLVLLRDIRALLQLLTQRANNVEGFPADLPQ